VSHTQHTNRDTHENNDNDNANHHDDDLNPDHSPNGASTNGTTNSATNGAITNGARPPTGRRGRAEALAGELYASSRGHLLRIARSNALNAEDAEESLQEAFIAFVQKFDPDGEAPPLAWLTLTMKRECWGRAKRAHLDRRAGQEVDHGSDEVGTCLAQLPDLGPSPQEHAELRERVAEVRAMIAQLKPDERRALTLKALGFSYREIGERTGWTYTKINRCIAEGRARLRALADAST
jgi:RNA polymerase sigma factor (sigma-70 family)